MFSRYGYWVLLAVSVVATPALGKVETLAHRGKRMCEEAGIPLSECMMLPPALRGVPQSPVAEPAPAPATTPPTAYGTGKYGTCEDCTSLFAAAPVTPWETFSGRQFQPNRDEDDIGTLDAASPGPAGTPGSAPSDSDDGSIGSGGGIDGDPDGSGGGIGGGDAGDRDVNVGAGSDGDKGGRDGDKGGSDGGKGARDGGKGGRDGDKGARDGGKGGRDGDKGAGDGDKGGRDGDKGGRDGGKGGRDRGTSVD